MFSHLLQHVGSYSLKALFESSVNFLQSFGLWLSGAAASLVTWQVGLLWFRLRLLLHRRVPHKGVTSARTHTHNEAHIYTNTLVSVHKCSRGPLVCRNLILVLWAVMLKIIFQQETRTTFSSTQHLLKVQRLKRVHVILNLKICMSWLCIRLWTSDLQRNHRIVVFLKSPSGQKVFFFFLFLQFLLELYFLEWCKKSDTIRQFLHSLLSTCYWKSDFKRWGLQT